MSADDQTFLDTLSAVPNDVKRFSGDIADYVDRHIEKVANALRETLSSSPWIPESARLRPPSKPPVPSKVVPVSLYHQAEHWVRNHKLLTGTFIVGIGAAIFFAYRKRKAYSKKRRAKRASNGARLEVVVIAGAPNEPITRSLALDLERRGFIVFVVCNDVEEEVMVQNEARSDIKPLTLDMSHTQTSASSIERLASYLQTPQHAFDGARPHHLIFTALILIPSLNYPSGPVATISPEHISDLLNTRLLHPILVTQSFLPLLSSLPYPHAHHHASPHPPPPRPKVIILTPTIISSLSPPFHAPESLIIAGLTAFTESLKGELAPLGIPVSHLKLGTFDFSTIHPRNQLQAQTLQAQRAEMLCWPEGTRQIYGRNFLSVAERGPTVGGLKGSPLRELHNAVFDAMTKRKSGIIRVGMGSSTYGFIGAWVPRGLVGWMIGMRKVKRTGVVSSGSESGSDVGKEEAGISGESEYVSLDR